MFRDSKETPKKLFKETVPRTRLFGSRGVLNLDLYTEITESA